MAIAKNFETALKKLEEAVERLENGELSLEEALKAFSVGVKQADVCRSTLREVELKVETLMKQGESWQKEPFDDE
jgi:exodeoxyribonuclease VII small subunit